VLAWAAGLCFGLPCIYAVWYFADRGQVWTFLGFPTYGDGPFEGVGIDTTTVLLAGFLAVCVAELVAGWLLWRRRRSGVVLALAVLPVELVFLDRLCTPDRTGSRGCADRRDRHGPRPGACPGHSRLSRSISLGIAPLAAGAPCIRDAATWPPAKDDER
jgi:hypothetical protein